MATIPIHTDPTLDAVRAAYMDAYRNEKRDYLGASLIGHPCSRAIWYQINHFPAIPSKPEWLWAAEDGHRIEEVIIERLKLVHGVEVWDKDDAGKQFGWSLLNGKYKGNLDGVVRGLLQAPKALHVLEIKCCNHKKYSEFQKAKVDVGEKRALKLWNPQYWAQAQANMHGMKMNRHYTIVALAGGRDVDSCRTEYEPESAEMLVDKAEKILVSNVPTARISEYKDFYACRMCKHREVCHNG